MDEPILQVVVDTREQIPYAFERYECKTIAAALPAGDYAPVGYEGCAALERKTIDDLVACLMGENRDRFERELGLLKSYSLGTVVVEGAMDDVVKHRYRSRMKPHAALQSILTFQVRYRVPFVWAGSRQGGEYVAYWVLQKFVRENECFAREHP
jgi:DNA excision repair protein ERCC-4